MGIRFLVAGLMSLCAAGPTAALAQAWPAKPITIVSPYPAGGITDLLSRIVAEQYAKALGQPVVVENRTGAGGAIAMASVAKAAPDGYTLVMGGSAPTAIIPALNPNATYKPGDFEPIGYVAGLPIIMVAHPSVPAANLKEFIAYARANAGKLNCAHHGNGTGTHLACVQFDRMTGSRMVAVSYKGAPQVNADLLTNRVQVYFGTLPTEIQYVRAGTLRSYGVAAAERVPSVPDIPTLGEEGLPGFTLDAWNALYAPAGTPKVVIARLSAELVRILGLPEVRKRIEATGSVVHPGSPEELRKLTLDEYESSRKLGAAANIRLD
jgi:tripartite-type tricarboxylate transporter receptor subunit TctC